MRWLGVAFLTFCVACVVLVAALVPRGADAFSAGEWIGATYGGFALLASVVVASFAVGLAWIPAPSKPLSRVTWGVAVLASLGNCGSCAMRGVRMTDPERPGVVALKGVCASATLSASKAPGVDVDLECRARAESAPTCEAIAGAFFAGERAAPGGLSTYPLPAKLGVIVNSATGARVCSGAFSQTEGAPLPTAAPSPPAPTTSTTTPTPRTEEQIADQLLASCTDDASCTCLRMQFYALAPKEKRANMGASQVDEAIATAKEECALRSDEMRAGVRATCTDGKKSKAVDALCDCATTAFFEQVKLEELREIKADGWTNRPLMMLDEAKARCASQPRRGR